MAGAKLVIEVCCRSARNCVIWAARCRPRVALYCTSVARRMTRRTPRGCVSGERAAVSHCSCAVAATPLAACVRISLKWECREPPGQNVWCQNCVSACQCKRNARMGPDDLCLHRLKLARQSPNFARTHLLLRSRTSTASGWCSLCWRRSERPTT